MANVYKHGSYGELGASVAQSAIQSGTVAVYIGAAPINLIQGWKDANLVNTPVKLNNFTDSQRKMGFVEDWKNFTLCEAMAAHFDNGVQNIGPIYAINVLNPDLHKKTQATNADVTFENNRAEIKTNTAILDTFSIEGFVKDKDFTIDYDFSREVVIINSLKDTLKDTKTVAFYEIDTTKINKDLIIGGVTAEGVYSGLGAIQKLYGQENQVANIIGVPGYSEVPEVYAKVINAAEQINGHWEAFVFADLPIKNSEGAAVDTFTKVRAWRDENGYDAERSEIYWPMYQDLRTKRVFHLSTLNIVAAMITDYSHNSVPFESASNKELPSGKLYFGEDSKNEGFDQVTATAELNAYGISTAVYWGGNWVTWGGHTAKYKFGKDIDVRAIDSHYIRMLYHCINGFQRRNGHLIDKPFSRQLKDSILNSEQDIIDGYIAVGALLKGSRIIFLEESNSESDMINGDWVFDIPVTVTPRAKSLTGKVYYTDEGLKSLVEEV